MAIDPPMLPSFTQRGLSLLNEAWRIALDGTGSFIHNSRLATACDLVFAGSEGGYRKAVVIQAAGKAADPSLDAQAMQKGNGADGSWDAREFAKKVFVPWNAQAGSPFTHAADPYVSNPYRVPRFDRSQRDQRQNKAGFDNALAVLEELNHASEAEHAFGNLVEVVYALRRYIAGRDVAYPLPSRASLDDTLKCVDAFVESKSGGARLQAVVLALFKALADQGMAYADFRSGHVNASDAAGKSAGDVAFNRGDVTFAVEVKDRPLVRAELDATIEKCRLANVTEILFVIRSSTRLVADLTDVELKTERDRQFSSGLNIYVERFEDICTSILTVIGEDGRRTFLEGVGTALADQNADITHKWAWSEKVRSI